MRETLAEIPENYMKKSTFSILILTIFVFCISCTSIKIAPETTNAKLELGSIDQFVSYEKQINSIDQTRDYLVDVSEGIYPFMKNHNFEIPKEFISMPESKIQILKRYYYLKNGDVKMIFIEWSEKVRDENANKKFEKIFEQLESKISEQLGNSSFKNLESKIVKNDETYRDGVKWQNAKLNAYLFRFGDNENRHNEINLVLYID